MSLFADLASRAEKHLARTGRPLVTLTYAQSLDGSISTRRDRQLALSGEPARRMTHRLRAAHDAILVGIGTVLADDPRLSARLVKGNDPQPIIIDTHLSLPLKAALLHNPALRPWVFAGEGASLSRQNALEAAGAKVFLIPLLDADLIDLTAVLDKLGELTARSVMVEGGARIITSFVKHQLADWLILTIAPAFVGGLNAIDPTIWGEDHPTPRLSQVRSHRMGDDLVLWGDFSRG